MANTYPFPMPINDPMSRQRPDRRGGLFVTDEWAKYLSYRDLAIDRAPSRVNDTGVALTAQGAAIATTSINTGSLSAGLYRVSYYARITRAATTSSSLTVTLRFTDGSVACAYSGAAITGNTTATFQSGSQVFHIDAASTISYETAYASVGATSMQYSLYIVVEQLEI